MKAILYAILTFLLFYSNVGFSNSYFRNKLNYDVQEWKKLKNDTLFFVSTENMLLMKGANPIEKALKENWNICPLKIINEAYFQKNIKGTDRYFISLTTIITNADTFEHEGKTRYSYTPLGAQFFIANGNCPMNDGQSLLLMNNKLAVFDYLDPSKKLEIHLPFIPLIIRSINYYGTKILSGELTSKKDLQKQIDALTSTIKSTALFAPVTYLSKKINSHKQFSELYPYESYIVENSELAKLIDSKKNVNVVFITTMFNTTNQFVYNCQSGAMLYRGWNAKNDFSLGLSKRYISKWSK